MSIDSFLSIVGNCLYCFQCNATIFILCLFTYRLRLLLPSCRAPNPVHVILFDCSNFDLPSLQLRKRNVFLLRSTGSGLKSELSSYIFILKLVHRDTYPTRACLFVFNIFKYSWYWHIIRKTCLSIDCTCPYMTTWVGNITSKQNAWWHIHMQYRWYKRWNY